MISLQEEFPEPAGPYAGLGREKKYSALSDGLKIRQACKP